MRPRPLARRLAFQYLFVRDLNRTDCDPPEIFLPQQSNRPEAIEFAQTLVRAAMEHEDAIDERLRAHLTNYSLERVAAVERNILRLGMAELMARTAPPNVVIDEAVELAKAFGGKDSGAFVNGILDAAARAAPPVAAPSDVGESTP